MQELFCNVFMRRSEHQFNSVSMGGIILYSFARALSITYALFRKQVTSSVSCRV